MREALNYDPTDPTAAPVTLDQRINQQVAQGYELQPNGTYEYMPNLDTRQNNVQVAQTQPAPAPVPTPSILDVVSTVGGTATLSPAPNGNVFVDQSAPLAPTTTTQTATAPASSTTSTDTGATSATSPPTSGASGGTNTPSDATDTQRLIDAFQAMFQGETNTGQSLAPELYAPTDAGTTTDVGSASLDSATITRNRIIALVIIVAIAVGAWYWWTRRKRGSTE